MNIWDKSFKNLLFLSTHILFKKPLCILKNRVIVLFTLTHQRGCVEWRKMADLLVVARRAADAAESAAQSGNRDRAEEALKKVLAALSAARAEGLCSRRRRYLEVCVSDARSAVARI